MAFFDHYKENFLDDLRTLGIGLVRFVQRYDMATDLVSRCSGLTLMGVRRGGQVLLVSRNGRHLNRSVSARARKVDKVLPL